MPSVSDRAKDRFRAHWLKLDRASKHVKELDGAFGRWMKSGPYETTLDLNADRTEQIAKVRRRKVFPERLVCVVADIIHNLHTSLDYLAFTLATEVAKCADTEALKKVYFPYGKNLGAFNDRLKEGKALKFFTKDIADFFREEEPYPGGKGEALYALHQLDVEDKHRSVIDLHSADFVRVSLPRQRKWIEFTPDTPDEVEFARYPLGEEPDHDPKAICRIKIGAVPGTTQHDLAMIGWYRDRVARVLVRAEDQFLPPAVLLLGD